MKKTILITLSALILTGLLIGIISAETPIRTESCYTYTNQWKVCTEKQTIENDFVKNEQLHYQSMTLTKLSLYNPQEELTKMNLNPEDYLITHKTIPKNSYAYKRLYLPEFRITSIIKNKLRGLERK